jgi:S1-C subfamily serine protease
VTDEPAPAPTTTGSAGTSVTVSDTVPSSSAPELTGEPLDIHELLAAVGPSVVNIEIGVPGRNGAVQPVAAGSGVVISADGLVLTNAHVVDLTDQFGRTLANAVITVKLSDGTERTATVLGADPSNDIALLRLEDARNLRPATLGDSDALRVGDEVVAIGNALGLGDSPTVTKGIVSATGRTLDVDANTTLTDLIQTDAPINHGNSGGALVNAAGEVVGINSAGIPDAQNVGFAIAVNTIKPLLSQLEAGGTSAPDGRAVAYLGVSTRQSVGGVTVVGVGAGTAAAAVGLQPGDVIVGIDGTAVESTDDLGSVLAARAPGDTITLEISRDGGARTVQATLGSRTR